MIPQASPLATGHVPVQVMNGWVRTVASKGNTAEHRGPGADSCGSSKTSRGSWIDRQINRTITFTTAGRSLASPVGQEQGANLETKAWATVSL